MLFMMAIGLYTGRGILNALGVLDLEMMSVASSVITMFTFLNAMLASGTQCLLMGMLCEHGFEKGMKQ